MLADGVMEGRRIFVNTLKYVLMATSSNFGNMFSAAGASLFLSFLPMLPPRSCSTTCSMTPVSSPSPPTGSTPRCSPAPPRGTSASCDGS